MNSFTILYGSRPVGKFSAGTQSGMAGTLSDVQINADDMKFLFDENMKQKVPLKIKMQFREQPKLNNCIWSGVYLSNFLAPKKTSNHVVFANVSFTYKSDNRPWLR